MCGLDHLSECMPSGVEEIEHTPEKWAPFEANAPPGWTESARLLSGAYSSRSVERLRVYGLEVVDCYRIGAVS